MGTRRGRAEADRSWGGDRCEGWGDSGGNKEGGVELYR